MAGAQPMPDNKPRRPKRLTVGREEFLADRQGRTFVDVLNDPDHVFDQVLEFFQDEDRQRRLEESETHHDRPALAGVVRELEAHPAVDEFLASKHPRLTKRFRQAVGVLVRILMERRGWRKTGKKGSLGVRAAVASTSTPGAYHNTGGLAFWFLRAERYEPVNGARFRTVRERLKHRSRPVGGGPPAGPGR
jgi:hypothetical protein